LFAFVTFVRTFAAWIYLFLIFGVLLGIKMLVDAQKLSRTTLFSLDQERASETTYRGLVVIAVFLIGMFVVTIIILLAPLAPAQDPIVLRPTTPTLPVQVFASSTPPPSPTATLPLRTETPFASTPIVITATRTITRPLASPIAPATATPALGLPAPKIIGPVPNGVVVTGFDRARVDLNFQWTWDCPQCRLGSEDFFVVSISFVDKNSGATRFVGGSTRNTFLSMADILRGAGVEVWQQAKDDAFQWMVQVKRGDQPLSAPSEIWKFKWH